MKRTLHRSRVDSTRVRLQIVLEGEDCEFNSPTYRVYQFRLLDQVVNNPDLVNCGSARPDRLVLSYTGKCWTLTAEAVVEEKNS